MGRGGWCSKFFGGRKQTEKFVKNINCSLTVPIKHSHCTIKCNHCAHQTAPLCPSNTATVPIICSHCSHQMLPLCHQMLPLCPPPSARHLPWGNGWRRQAMSEVLNAFFSRPLLPSSPMVGLLIGVQSERLLFQPIRWRVTDSSTWLAERRFSVRKVNIQAPVCPYGCTATEYGKSSGSITVHLSAAAYYFPFQTEQCSARQSITIINF